MTDNTPSIQKKLTQISFLKQVANVTGGFTILLVVILIINFLQLKSTDPLELESLENLLAQYDDDPKNEMLKEEIRSLDLMARKAFFTKEWQLRTGGVLVLFFLTISLVSLRMVQSLKFKLELPGALKKENDWQIKTQTRNSMMYVGVFLVGLVLVVYYFTDQEFNNYLSNPAAEVPDIAEAIAPETETTIENKISEVPQKEEKEDSKEEDVIITAPPAQESKRSVEEKQEPTKIKDSEAAFKKNHVAFRGYRSLGISYGTNIPMDWDGKSGKNIKWKSEIPRPGYSSPIIWEDLLFITGGDNTAREVYCFNRLTGKLAWTALVTGIPGSPEEAPEVTEDTGLAASTMTTDGKYVFAIFATGDVICLDMTGKKIWAKNLGVPVNHYGHSSSLLLHKNILFIQYDDRNSAKLIGLDTQTGEEKFKTMRKSAVSWTSPILIERGNKVEIVVDSDPGVAAYDAKTGKESWQVDCLYGEIGASPVFNGKYVFAGNEYAKFVAIEPGENASIIWEGYDLLPEVSSPVATDKFVLSATSFGLVGSFDANTGELLWENEFNQGFYASPILVEGKIYLLGMQGTMFIIKQSETFELLAQSDLGEATVSTPAFVDGYIYIRANNNLYCITEK